jgi:hypothetical protein
MFSDQITSSRRKGQFLETPRRRVGRYNRNATAYVCRGVEAFSKRTGMDGLQSVWKYPDRPTDQSLRRTEIVRQVYFPGSEATGGISSVSRELVQCHQRIFMAWRDWYGAISVLIANLSVLIANLPVNQNQNQNQEASVSCLLCCQVRLVIGE